MIAYVLNFTQRTGVESVSEIVQISSIEGIAEVREISVLDFYSPSVYECAREVEFLKSSGGGGAIMLGINYPLQTQREVKFVKDFVVKALESGDNFYYYPKPNAFFEVNDFALCSVKKAMTTDNFKIEMLYMQGLINRDLRGRLHKLLRKSRDIPPSYYNKKFFYESRKLFNLSYLWREFEVSKKDLEQDLVENIDIFYPHPLEINIATTNVCNLKCVMCQLHAPHLQKNHKTDFFKQKQFLDEKTVYGIIDYAAKNGINNISFTAAGEVTLDDRICSFLKYAKSKGIGLICLVTNGVLLEKYADSLLESGLNRMTVSIDGATPEIYKKIRGADLHKVENGVKKAIKCARELNLKGSQIEIELACVLVYDYMHTKEQQELYLSKWENDRDIITRISFNELAVFDEQGWDTRNNAIIDRNNRNVCHYPYSRLMINPYGEATVCCTMSTSAYYAPFSVGNVLEQGLDEIWNSSKMKALRMENLRKSFREFSICARCNEWSYNDFRDGEISPSAKEKVIVFSE